MNVELNGILKKKYKKNSENSKHWIEFSLVFWEMIIIYLMKTYKLWNYEMSYLNIIC